MRKVASHFYTLRIMLHIQEMLCLEIARDCSRTKILKAVHLETLEASAFRSIVHWKHFQKLKPKAVFH